MMYWGNGMGGWGMALMTASTLLFWGLVIAGIVALVRYTGRGGYGGAPSRRSPYRNSTQFSGDRCWHEGCWGRPGATRRGTAGV